MRKIALVTGGVGGIGTAICKRLADLLRSPLLVAQFLRHVRERVAAEQFFVAGVCRLRLLQKLVDLLSVPRLPAATRGSPWSRHSRATILG